MIRIVLKVFVTNAYLVFDGVQDEVSLLPVFEQSSFLIQVPLVRDVIACSRRMRKVVEIGVRACQGSLFFRDDS